MRISEDFVKNILKDEYKENYQVIYDNSCLIQYLDKKMGAVHGDSKIIIILNFCLMALLKLTILTTVAC